MPLAVMVLHAAFIVSMETWNCEALLALFTIELAYCSKVALPSVTVCNISPLTLVASDAFTENEAITLVKASEVIAAEVIPIFASSVARVSTLIASLPL